MGRAPCCDKANVKKGPWSPEEDLKLKDYIEKNGTGGNWIALPQKAGLKRCGKSCRLRWLNYLRPNIKHGEFSDEEDRVICTLFATIGSRWSIIAAQLPGRTDNDIKNYWNTKLKKKFISLAAPFPCSTTHHKIKPPTATAPLPFIPSHLQITSSSLAPLYHRDCTSFINYTTCPPSNDISSSDLSKYPIANSSINSSPLFQFQDCGISMMSSPMSRYCHPSCSSRKENMLKFGSNDQASCSSDDCCSYNGTKEMKQEDLVTLQSGCYNNMSSPTGLFDENNDNKFMLMSYSTTNNNNSIIGSTQNVNTYWTDKAANGFYGESTTLLEDHDVQDVKQQLMTISTSCTSDINNNSSSSFNFIEENKTAVEKTMYYNYYY